MWLTGHDVGSQLLISHMSGGIDNVRVKGARLFRDQNCVDNKTNRCGD